MDSLFDDDQDEVGSEIEAYCPGPRCKADTNHTIISMYEDEVRRVQCAVCGDVHAYRKPRGEAYEPPEQTSTPKRSRSKKKPTWEEAMAQVTEAELNACRPYSILDTYEDLDVVSHPSFGVGFATERLPDNKVEITFKDERRVLVHNRSDLADRMPEISDAPAPREVKKRRKKKSQRSELATRLLQERAKAGIKSKDFAEQAAAKQTAAERAAEIKKRIAQGFDPEAEAAAEAEKERIRLEKEKEKARKEREREREKARKERERERERARKEREREKARRQKEREREKARKEREREKARKEREREKARKEREREKARKEREREKKAREREREKARKERLRRTGGKKTIPSTKKKSTAKKSTTRRATPKRKPTTQKRKPAKKPAKKTAAKKTTRKKRR